MSQIVFQEDDDGRNGRAYCMACHWAGAWAPKSAFDPTETLLSNQDHRCVEPRVHVAENLPNVPPGLSDSDVNILVGLTVADLGHYMSSEEALRRRGDDSDYFRSQAADKLAAEAKRRGLL